MEISGDVTDVGRTNKRRQTREDRATQPMDCWKAEFRKKANIYKMLAKLGKGLKLAYMVCMQIQDTSSENRILTTS